MVADDERAHIAPPDSVRRQPFRGERGCPEQFAPAPAARFLACGEVHDGFAVGRALGVSAPVIPHQTRRIDIIG
jgi:hypothetical protein